MKSSQIIFHERKLVRFETIRCSTPASIDNKVELRFPSIIFIFILLIGLILTIFVLRKATRMTSSIVEQPVFFHRFDFTADICHDFYNFVCRQWIIAHPLSVSEIKRTWFTEKSREIRTNFHQFLINASRSEFEHGQTKKRNEFVDYSLENSFFYSNSVIEDLRTN